MRFFLVPVLILSLVVSSAAALYGLQEARQGKVKVKQSEQQLQAITELHNTQRLQFMEVLYANHAKTAAIRDLLRETPDYSNRPIPSSIATGLCQHVLCRD